MRKIILIMVIALLVLPGAFAAGQKEATASAAKSVIRVRSVRR
jgi:hypothetical protein